MSTGLRMLVDWRITAFVVVLLPLMVSLGFWQLRRAEENRGLLLAAEQQRAQPPVLLDTSLLQQVQSDVEQNQAQAHALQAVSMQGTWRPEMFLLENQPHEGRNGYQVLAVMVLADGGNVLVNRGWVAAPALRSELPTVPSPTQGALELGELYLPAHILRDEPVFAESGWPKRIGRLQIPGLAREAGMILPPVVVRLRENSPSALTVHWPVVNIAPEKNTAYAIQWFAMSVALLICYLALWLRQRRETVSPGESRHG